MSSTIPKFADFAESTSSNLDDAKKYRDALLPQIYDLAEAIVIGKNDGDESVFELKTKFTKFWVEQKQYEILSLAIMCLDYQEIKYMLKKLLDRVDDMFYKPNDFDELDMEILNRNLHFKSQIKSNNNNSDNRTIIEKIRDQSQSIRTSHTNQQKSKMINNTNINELKLYYPYESDSRYQDNVNGSASTYNKEDTTACASFESSLITLSPPLSSQFFDTKTILHGRHDQSNSKYNNNNNMIYNNSNWNGVHYSELVYKSNTNNINISINKNVNESYYCHDNDISSNNGTHRQSLHNNSFDNNWTDEHVYDLEPSWNSSRYDKVNHMCTKHFGTFNRQVVHNERHGYNERIQDSCENWNEPFYSPTPGAATLFKSDNFIVNRKKRRRKKRHVRETEKPITPSSSGIEDDTILNE